MTARPVAWVLNLDADNELRRPTGYGPTAAISARTRELVPKIAKLVRSQDVVLGAEPLVAPERYVGLAWCPTPRALRLLAGAGVPAGPAPPLEVLRRVNHRRFCSDLGQTLSGAERIGSEEELVRVISRGREWLLKRPFSFAGNSRRMLRGATPTDADAAWVTASLSGGESLQVEPRVAIESEYALHGYLSQSGAATFGEVCVQVVDAFGSWAQSMRASAESLSTDERNALHREGERVAEALHAAGYFGPFGIDAYRHRDGFNPRSEINARYTMGWAIGLGDTRPDIEG